MSDKYPPKVSNIYPPTISTKMMNVQPYRTQVPGKYPPKKSFKDPRKSIKYSRLVSTKSRTPPTPKPKSKKYPIKILADVMAIQPDGIVGTLLNKVTPRGPAGPVSFPTDVNVHPEFG